MGRRLFLLFLLFPGCMSVSGQDRVIQAPEVRVSAPRPEQTALTRSAVDSLVLAQGREGSLADLLGRYSPLFVKSAGGGAVATVSFRGTAASHTQVRWNGLPIDDPMSGQVDFSLIPAAFVDRAELLHGGSSLAAGPGALGGTVLLGSSPRWSDRLYGSLSQGAGSFGTYQTLLSAGGGGQRVQVRGRYLWEQAQNDFSYLNTAIPPFERTAQQHADYRKQGAVVDLFVRPAQRQQLTLNAWWQTAARNLPAVMSYEGAGRNEQTRDDALRMAARWNRYGEKLHAEAGAGYAATRLDYLLENKTGAGWMTNHDSDNRADRLQLHARGDWRAAERTLLRGRIDYEHQGVRSSDRVDPQAGYDARRDGATLTLSAHQSLGRRWNLYALAAQQLVDGAFTPLMPSVGAEYAASKTVTLRANAARNYHQPSLNDLYWMPGGNPDLDPEQGYTADLGATFRQAGDRAGIEATATGYLSWIDDWIVWQPGEYHYWTAENLKRVFARGVEAAMRTHWACSPAWKLRLEANYAYTRTTSQQAASPYDASVGRQLIYVPVHKAAALVDCSYRSRAWITLQWNYVGERFTNSANDPVPFALPAYSLVDLSVGGNWGPAELQLTVRNLFDLDYQAILWRAMPGRNFYAQLRFSF